MWFIYAVLGLNAFLCLLAMMDSDAAQYRFSYVLVGLVSIIAIVLAHKTLWIARPITGLLGVIMICVATAQRGVTDGIRLFSIVLAALNVIALVISFL